MPASSQTINRGPLQQASLVAPSSLWLMKTPIRDVGKKSDLHGHKIWDPKLINHWYIHREGVPVLLRFITFEGASYHVGDGFCLDSGVNSTPLLGLGRSGSFSPLLRSRQPGNSRRKIKRRSRHEQRCAHVPAKQRVSASKKKRCQWPSCLEIPQTLGDHFWAALRSPAKSD